MALADMQRSLARLYTDADTQARFAADPRAAASEWGLSANDADTLACLPTAQVAVFARSLIAKRSHEAAKLLPLTRRALGADFAAQFRRYAATCPIPNAPRPHPADALAFAAFLRRQKTSWEPPWAMDALRYEVLCLRASQPGKRLLAARFSYVGARLIKEGAVPRRRPLLGLWLCGSGHVLHWLLPWV